MSGKQLRNLHAGNRGRNCAIRTTILRRRRRLGVVSFEVTGTTMQPDDEEGGIFSRLLGLGVRAPAKQFWQRKAGQPGKAEAEELPATQRTWAHGALRVHAFHGFSIGWMHF